MDSKNSDTLHIYIDESSTLGFKKLEPYFIICALIVTETEKRPLKNSAKRILKEIRLARSIEELHASEMSFQEKQTAFNEFTDKDFSIQYLVAHKESIHENLFKKKNVCFNYFVYLTLKEVLEKTHIKEISITIDTRSVKVTSEKSLEEYLNAQLANSEIYHKNIYVQYGDSKNFLHLQLVDLCANAIYARYTFNKSHFYSYLTGKVSHRELFPQRHYCK
jgi:hypothetical protein